MKNRWTLTKIGQSTAEYATMFMIILVLISVMQTFLKRAQQASIRKVTRDMISVGVNNGVFEGTLQFEPGYQSSEMHMIKHSNGFEEIKGGGGTHRYSYSKSYLDSAKTSYENVLAYNETDNMSKWGWKVKISGSDAGINNGGDQSEDNGGGDQNGGNEGGEQNEDASASAAAALIDAMSGGSDT